MRKWWFLSGLFFGAAFSLAAERPNVLFIFADDTTGRIINALDASGLGDNSIVIFSSDNGFHMGEKHHFGKYTLWENSAQVPFLVRMPKNQNAGSTCSATISLVDLYPTLSELCSLDEPKHQLDGDSFAAQLNEPSKEWNRPAITSYAENETTLRDETWRYIHYADGTEELYDLEKYPSYFGEGSSCFRTSRKS